MIIRSTRGVFLRIARLTLAGAALFVAAGCGRDLISPVGSSAPFAPQAPDLSRSSSRGRPDLHHNDEKYGDHSRRHGFGHVGDASVEALSLLGADHLTRVTLSTGTIDPLAAGNGVITQVKVKAYDPNGGRLYVTNFNHLTPAGVQTLVLANLMRGAILQMRVHVRGTRSHKTNCGCKDKDDDRGRGDDHGRGSDNDRGRGDDHGSNGSSYNNGHNGHDGWNDDDDCDDDPRTDVVTVTDTVQAAPSLNVDLQVPPSVLAGAPTVINAVVSETGGDVGTHADCQLYVGGKLVDTAAGIWVDAGDAVTCAFTYTFTGTGPQNVEVRVNGTPTGSTTTLTADDSGSFDVLSPNATHYTATAEDRSVTTLTVHDYTWFNTDGGHKEYSDSTTNVDRQQTITIQGTLSRAAAFPLATIDLTMSSAGISWETEHWAGMAAVADPTTGQLCVNQQMTDQGAVFYICNGLGGATFGYTRFAGTVTYHSWGYSNVFDGPTATQNNYTWNDQYQTHQSGGQVRSWGSALSMNLSIADGQGTFGIAPVIPLTSFAGPLDTTPRTCVTDSPYWLNGGTQTTCDSGRTDEAGLRGSTAG